MESIIPRATTATAPAQATVVLFRATHKSGRLTLLLLWLLLRRGFLLLLLLLLQLLLLLLLLLRRLRIAMLHCRPWGLALVLCTEAATTSYTFATCPVTNADPHYSCTESTRHLQTTSVLLNPRASCTNASLQRDPKNRSIESLDIRGYNGHLSALFTQSGLVLKLFSNIHIDINPLCRYVEADATLCLAPASPISSSLERVFNTW